MPDVSTYTPIAQYTVTGSSTAAIEFTSIPGTYTDLVITATGRSTAVGNKQLDIIFNNDNGASSYSRQRIYSGLSITGTNGDGGASLSILGELVYIPGTDSNSNLNSSGWFEIFQYANTNVYKTAVGGWSSTGTTSYYSLRQVATWRSTSAITTIKVYSSAGGNIDVGSVVSLYGIKAN
jgi:hypothetical protein